VSDAGEAAFPEPAKINTLNEARSAIVAPVEERLNAGWPKPRLTGRPQEREVYVCKRRVPPAAALIGLFFQALNRSWLQLGA